MKKNIHKIPQDIQTKLESIKNEEIIVGCAVKFKAGTLASGDLAHIGIILIPGGLQFPSTVIPPETQGKYSNQNVNGFEIIRKDLPMETHYNRVESPNYGDSYNGTHIVELPYKKYPRNFRPPRELEISIACKDARPNISTYIITFQVREVLNKTAKDFKDRLFENLNLLQENIGDCGVEAADIPLSDYVKSLHVSWEILPPGTLDEIMERLFQGKNPTVQEKNIAKERSEFFASLKPRSLVFGQSGFRRYFGALLEDDLVVFENIEYGNAIYILLDNWEDLSKRSRVDLMSGKFGTSFERVIHSSDWKDEVRAIVVKRRKKHN